MFAGFMSRYPAGTFSYVSILLLKFETFSDFLGRLQPLVTTPEKPQIKVMLCQNEARGGTYVLT